MTLSPRRFADRICTQTGTVDKVVDNFVDEPLARPETADVSSAAAARGVPGWRKEREAPGSADIPTGLKRVVAYGLAQRRAY